MKFLYLLARVIFFYFLISLIIRITMYFLLSRKRKNKTKDDNVIDVDYEEIK